MTAFIESIAEHIALAWLEPLSLEVRNGSDATLVEPGIEHSDPALLERRVFAAETHVGRHD